MVPLSASEHPTKGEAVNLASPALPRPSSWLLTRDVVVLGVIWGSSVVLQRMALAEMTPLPLMTLRLLLALVYFVPLLPRIVHGLSISRRDLQAVLIVGALNPGASGVYLAFALAYASSGLVALLTSLGPLIAALLAMILLREPALRRGQVAALVIAFGGVALLIATRSTGLQVNIVGDARGALFGLIVPLALALSAVYARRFLGEIDATVAVAGQVVGGMLFVVPIQFIRAEPLHIFQLSAGAWLAVALSGVIGLSASFVLLLRIIRNHGPTAAMLNLYVVPATAAALGVFALGETITPAMFVGAALVFGGVFLFTRS